MNWTIFLLRATVFLSAFLLFSVQLMFGKMVLPHMGGTPAVWNTCMVFFQAVLLAGYSYAHISATIIRSRLTRFAHLALMFVPFLVLPIHIPHGWQAPAVSNPIASLLGLMTLSVGLPFLVVSTSAPLLQKWFADSSVPGGKDPYFLYAASNGGSLLGLLSYPVLVEPHLRLRDQAIAWAWGYGVLVALMVGCAVFLGKGAAGSAASVGRSSEDLQSRPDPVSISRKLRWVMLSFVPSSLMLGLTTHWTTDIASIPLLWMLPLAAYLLSFVFVFSRKSPISHDLMLKIFPYSVTVLIVLLCLRVDNPIGLILLLPLLVFFVMAMACHGELAKDRPGTGRLTEFFLWMSLGGVLGGLFNALVAPLVFKTVIEFPIAIGLACLLMPNGEGIGEPRSRRVKDFLVPAMVALFLYSFAKLVPSTSAGKMELPFALQALILALYLTPVFVLLLCRKKALRFALVACVYMFFSLFAFVERDKILATERNFFGIYTVAEFETVKQNRYHHLIHGTTIHGIQSLDPARENEALSYYHAPGPAGLISSALQKRATNSRIAVIGLGAGSLAVYARPGQRWDFYEIDPLVKEISENPAYFTFLKNCKAEYRVILGDGRLSMIKAPDGNYEVIVLDTFSSDSIPVHMMTREAIELYVSKLGPHGILVFNITNRYFNLERVLARIAGAVGLQSVYTFDQHEGAKDAEERNERGIRDSKWFVMARREGDLGGLINDKRWRKPSAEKAGSLWTDDFSDVIGALQ